MNEDRSSERLALEQSARRANEILGVSSLSLERCPDNRMDSMDLLDIVKIVESHVKRTRPSIVLTHHTGDVNVDHRCVHQAVITACRPVPGFEVDTLLFFEVPSSTEWQPANLTSPFVPTWFEDITDTWVLKRKALEAYSSEMRSWPHARSIQAVEHLVRWRGATVGVEAAEAFILGRKIQKRDSNES